MTKTMRYGNWLVKELIKNKYLWEVNVLISMFNKRS